MALNDLKKGITDEARDKVDLAEADARAEAKLITDEAKAVAKKNVAEVKEALKWAEKATVEQAEGDSRAEALGIVQKAADSAVEAELHRIRKQIEIELSRRHMDGLVKSALKRFRDVAPPDETIVEITKRHAPLVKNVFKVIPMKEEGHLVLYTKDGKVTLDSSVTTVVESNLHSIKSMLVKSMEL